MRGGVVCFIAPATFLTSLGLIEAAMTRTNAVVSSAAGAGASAKWRTEGSPKASKRNARMTCSHRLSSGLVTKWAFVQQTTSRYGENNVCDDRKHRTPPYPLEAARASTCKLADGSREPAREACRETRREADRPPTTRRA